MANFCRIWDVLRPTCFGILLCIFAPVGAFVGMIAGAIVGKTKEIGFFKGASIGSFSGVILSMEVFELMVYGRILSLINFLPKKITNKSLSVPPLPTIISADTSKLALEAVLFSMLNGSVLTEWVTPAIETAYQQQVDGVDTSSEVAFSIFRSGGTKGLLQDSIQKLQRFDISYKQKHEAYVHQTSCAICLQDFKEGEAARKLPRCKHTFHIFCIDKWLVRRGCCPICRSGIFV